MEQLDLFEIPDIRAATTLAGVDVWYDCRRCVWTTEIHELRMTDEEINAFNEKRNRAHDD